MKSKARTRVFACVVYPESAPENWLSILKDGCVPAFVSPLHDQDIDPDGNLKKPHYHVLLMYDGVKSIEQFEEFRNTFGGVGREVVQSIRGYARYLCHLDNPEKHRYSAEEVVEIGGSDYLATISRSSDKYNQIRQMISFVRENHITNYCDLMDYAEVHNQNWFVSLCDNSSFVMNTYISDMRRDLGSR